MASLNSKQTRDGFLVGWVASAYRTFYLFFSTVKTKKSDFVFVLCFQGSREQIRKRGGRVFGGVFFFCFGIRIERGEGKEEIATLLVLTKNAEEGVRRFFFWPKLQISNLSPLISACLRTFWFLGGFIINQPMSVQNEALSDYD